MTFIPGGIASPKDKRDFNLGMYQAPEQFPLEYATDISKVKRLYQNGWPACGSHAGAHLKEIQDEGGEYSPSYLWTEIKKTDGFPMDAGTTMRAIFKTLKDKGVCDYPLLPNDYSLNLADYTNRVITEEMTENAKPKGISSYAFLPSITAHELKRAIWLNKVVLLLIWCDNGFFGTNNPTFTQKYLYGHFVVAYGYDFNNILILDSTERDIAHATKKIPLKHLDFIREVGTTIDLPDQFIFTENMHYGSVGEQVTQLQKRLEIPQTGRFDVRTLFAVIAYQYQNSLPVTGFCYALTRAKLNTS